MRGVCKPSLYNFFVNLKSFQYKKFIFKKSAGRTSLVIQWLRLHSSNAEGKGLLSGWGTKSPHASQHKCVLNRFSCVRLCDPMNCSLPGSSVQGILQARILEWVAIPSSRGSSQPRVRTHISYISCTGRWVLYHLCHLRSLNKIK